MLVSDQWKYKDSKGRSWENSTITNNVNAGVNGGLDSEWENDHKSRVHGRVKRRERTRPAEEVEELVGEKNKTGANGNTSTRDRRKNKKWSRGCLSLTTKGISSKGSRFNEEKVRLEVLRQRKQHEKLTEKRLWIWSW